MRRIKALLLTFMFFISGSFTCFSQVNSATSGQQTQYESYLSKYIVEFFDVGKLVESITLLNMFGTEQVKSAISEFEQKVPVKLYLSGAFGNNVNAFWPNFFRNSVLSNDYKESNRLEIIAFFNPEDGQYYKASDTIKVFSTAIYGQEIDTLEKRINKCLRNRSYSLASTIVRDCIIENLQLMAQEHNEQHLCENSPVKGYVESSLNFLIDSIKGKIQKLTDDIAEIQGTVTIKEDNSLSDLIIIEGKERELTPEEITQLSTDEIISRMYKISSIQREKDLYVSILADIEVLNKNDNLCSVIWQIESERKEQTAPLFELISKQASERSINQWLYGYLVKLKINSNQE